MQNYKIIQKKPRALFYWLLGGLVVFIGRLKWKMKFYGVKPSGPALIISNHTSNIDWIIEGAMAFPKRVTFLITYHFFTFKFIGFLLRRFVRAIPKYQFATDLLSIKKIKSVLHYEKGLVYIAPEGTVWGSGTLGYISPSICKLIKMLNVPVYASNIQGTGLGVAKWSKKLHRTEIQINTCCLFSENEIQDLSINEMHTKIINALNYNDFDFQKQNNVLNKSKDLAEGFENLFFICPHCNSEFTLSSEGNTVCCSECKTQAVIGKDFRFTWNTEKQFFDNYTQWYNWQLEKMKALFKKPDFSFSEEVDYGIDIDGVNNYKKVGHGLMTVNHNGWTYKGSFFDKQVEEHDELRQVPLATLKVGKHFELPYKFNHCRAFYPVDGVHAAKWHILSRAISELLAENKN